MKHFCTAGPVKPDIHYCLDPISRVNHPRIRSLIDGQRYFILHAPRQTGKTSVLFGLIADLNASGRYRALYVNVEGAQPARNDIGAAMDGILSELGRRARTDLGDEFPAQYSKEALQAARGDALGATLEAWCSRSPLPICLMIDEIDAMVGDSLISVLRQLRAGYAHRPRAFPQSIVLCGVRDLRDYRIHGSNEIITGGSAFNIKAESLRLGDFTPGDIRALYAQHTTQTGQRFDEDVFPLVWDYTRGQPWLVNALADQACFVLETDRARPITEEIIARAKENLILRRDTHLDQLGDKLSEERVRRVVQPILNGEEQLSSSVYDDDTQYVIDLGLIRRSPETGLEISNGIYREVIPRELSYQTQISFEATQRTAWYVAKDGRLDVPKLLAAFQQFFRENAEAWLERFTYKEAGPQLLLQAFLQRIVNGGGRIDREYALGRRRTDLLLYWKHGEEMQRVVIEIKVVHKGVTRTIKDGLAQTAEYLDRTGAAEGHLVVFNRTPRVPWKTKIFRQTKRSGKHTITVWGM